VKINRLEAHDRLKHFRKDQEQNIFQGAEECLKKNPLSLAIQEKMPYVYLFAHPRTGDDGVTKVMYWQPRISIPACEDNSYLFRAISNTDLVDVVWLIPPMAMWGQYEMGKVTESNDVLWCINQYKSNKSVLERPHPDDWPEERSQQILKLIVNEHSQTLKNNKAKLILSLTD